MLEDFTGCRGAALVAGATGAIGGAIARLLSARGSAVALTYRTRAPGAQAPDAQAPDAQEPHVQEPGVDLPGPTRAWQLDLTDAEDCAVVVADAAAAFGGLHTVVYAAGPHVPMVHLSRVSPAQFRSQLEQDTVAFFNLVSPALAHLRATGGSLVAVTTAATRRFPVRDGLSAGPKGAIEALVRGIAAEEGRFGVRANCVGPGMLSDGMAARLIASADLDESALAVIRANIALRRFGTAEDVAEAVCFLASDRARYVSGQKLDVDGGYTC